MKLRIDPITAVVAFLWLASLAGAFFGGRATKPSEYVSNSTNVVINNNYAVSMSSSASASVAVGFAQSNVNVVFEYDVTNLIFSVTNYTQGGY